MRHKLTARLVMLALGAVSGTPALAQDYRFVGFDAPRGTTASLNLRIPFGSRAEARGHRPSFGFTLGHARALTVADSGAWPATRQMPLLDIRIDRRGLRQAQMASFDLVHLDRDPRLNFQDDGSDGNRTMRLVLIGLLGVAVGIGAEMILDSSEDEEETSDATPTTPNPG